MNKLMANAAIATGEIKQENIGDREQEFSKTLHFMLTMLCKGKALKKLRTAPAGAGLEVWRKFHTDFEPKVKGRFGAPLTCHRNRRAIFGECQPPAADRAYHDTVMFGDPRLLGAHALSSEIRTAL